MCLWAFLDPHGEGREANWHGHKPFMTSWGSSSIDYHLVNKEFRFIGGGQLPSESRQKWGGETPLHFCRDGEIYLWETRVDFPSRGVFSLRSSWRDAGWFPIWRTSPCEVSRETQGDLSLGWLYGRPRIIVCFMDYCLLYACCVVSLIRCYCTIIIKI